MTTPTTLSRMTQPWLAWKITGLAVALLLAVCFPGMHTAADDADPPKKKEPKKEERPKVEVTDQMRELKQMMEDLRKEMTLNKNELEALQKALEQMGQMGPQGPMQLENFQREMQRAMDQMRQLPGMPGVRGLAPSRPQPGRLGVNVSKPTDALVDQLDLPQGKGLVIDQVTADSAADKAGLKANDILLELDGKPVPDDPLALSKMVGEIKADKPITVVIFRKGKKVAIKELSLPQAKVQAVPGKRGPRVFEIVPPGRPAAPRRIPKPIIPKIPALPGGQGMVMTNVTRTGDQFTAGQQEGTLHISVIGTIENGKAKVKTITVQDVADTQTYQTVDKVDEKYRDKVKRLIELAEKGEGTRIEIQPR